VKCWHLEDLFDQLAHQQDIAICCSFLMDHFDGEVHTRMLPRLGENHSHLIPVEDYARLELAVADALRATVGADEARVLEERLLQGYPSRFHMPRAQALLLALGQVLPVVADAVRKRTRTLYTASAESTRRRSALRRRMAGSAPLAEMATPRARARSATT
jgi:hypothetical protein